MLGYIQFIGHLYNFEIITEKIMHECMVELLGSPVCMMGVTLWAAPHDLMFIPFPPCIDALKVLMT